MKEQLLLQIRLRSHIEDKVVKDNKKYELPVTHIHGIKDSLTYSMVCKLRI